MQESCWEINSLPAVGHECNKGYFSQLQINIAGVVEHDSSVGLDKNLGKAGAPHYDSHDCQQAYTCMFAMCNFAKYGIHPGMFHLLELGLYVELFNYRFIYFSGLHFHAGSPPRAPFGVPIPDDAVRFVEIHYPNEHLLSGLSVPAVIAAGGGGSSRVEVLAGSRYDPECKAKFQKGPLNFIRDAPSMMTRNSYLDYIPKQIAIHLESILAQSPFLQLNTEALGKLFMDRDSGEVFDYCKDWKYAPGKLTEDLKEDMRRISRQVEEAKVEVSLSVPTQIRRLYNSNKLKLEPGPDGKRVLAIQMERVFASTKKQKGE